MSASVSKVLADYASGKNLRQTGAANSITHERVRQILVANGVKPRPWGSNDTTRARQAGRA